MDRTPDRPVSAFDILALVSTGGGHAVHLLLYLPVLAEKIRTGGGYASRLEESAVILWMAEAATIPFLLFGLVYIIIALAKNRNRVCIAVTAGLLATALAYWLLTNLLLFL